jgi:putative tricarboxylic transport membrane protein
LSWRPQRPLQLVAGTPPGGGLDRSARALAGAITAGRLAEVAVEVVNVGGDGGRKAWVHMDGLAGDGHVAGISSPNMTADFLMGVTRSDPARFTPLAILYTEYIAFVVRTHDPMRHGGDLVARLAHNPQAVTIALSTSRGNSNHVAVAQVIRRAGAEVNAPQIRVFDTALDAVADVVAGHADVGAITAASPVPELRAGRLRTVAISSPQRLPDVFAGAPTWREQGVDCVIGSWRGVSGPAGLAADQIAWWQGLLSRAVATPQWAADLVRHFWTPMYLDGAALADHLGRERDEMRAVLSGLGLLGP